MEDFVNLILGPNCEDAYTVENAARMYDEILRIFSTSERQLTSSLCNAYVDFRWPLESTTMEQALEKQGLVVTPWLKAGIHALMYFDVLDAGEDRCWTWCPKDGLVEECKCKTTLRWTFHLDCTQVQEGQQHYAMATCSFCGAFARTQMSLRMGLGYLLCCVHCDASLLMPADDALLCISCRKPANPMFTQRYGIRSYFCSSEANESRQSVFLLESSLGKSNFKEDPRFEYNTTL